MPESATDWERERGVGPNVLPLEVEAAELQHQRQGGFGLLVAVVDEEPEAPMPDRNIGGSGRLAPVALAALNAE